MHHRLVVGSLVLVSLALAYIPEVAAAQAPAAKSAAAAQPKAAAPSKLTGPLAMPRMAVTTVRIKPERPPWRRMSSEAARSGPI